MKYTVRNQDGEVAFESFDALKKAAAEGLVEATDEVRREDESSFRPAAQVPRLLDVAAQRRAGLSAQTLWLSVAIVGGVAAFVLLLKGGSDPQFYVYGVAVAFVVAGVLFKVTRDAAQRRR